MGFRSVQHQAAQPYHLAQGILADEGRETSRVSSATGTGDDLNIPPRVAVDFFNVRCQLCTDPKKNRNRPYLLYLFLKAVAWKGRPDVGAARKRIPRAAV
jgi:hypothetical protein